MTDTAQKEVKLIALYGRVSTSLQEDQKTIENQLMAMKDFADQKFGKGNYTIIREYLDEGWSGDTIVRPALDQLRMDAEKKIWEAVLMYDPDRLARRYSYQEVVMDDLQEQNIEILFVTVPPIRDENDQMLYEMRGAFARYERTKIAERFRLGKKRKAENGHILTTEAPYGYTYVPNKKDKAHGKEKIHGYYEINEEEAMTVRKIFRWIAEEGLTLRKVVRRLQELGVMPRKSTRGVWNTSTLSTLLRNKAYIGEAHWGSSYAVVPKRPLKVQQYKKIKKTSRRMRPEGEWIASKIPVPVIIDQDLFMRVRAQLKLNFELCQRNTRNEYLLSGKIRCACGRTRAGEGPQHGKHLYYRCTDRVLNYPLPRICKEGGINARIADTLVWQKITELMSSKELMLDQIQRWMTSRRDRTQNPATDTDAIEKEIGKLKEKMDRYMKAYGEGLFSMEKLREYTVPIRDRIASLEDQIAQAGILRMQLNDDPLPKPHEIEAFAARATEILQNLNFEGKREIVRDVIEKIVATQQELQVFGRIPLTLNHVAYKTGYRHRRTAQCGEIHSFQRTDAEKG